MPVAPFDQQENSRRHAVAAPVNQCATASANNEEPLVSPGMAIARIAFRLSGLQHHLGRLRSAITQNDTKAFAEAKLLVLHQTRPNRVERYLLFLSASSAAC